ncbi:transglutaminase family protein [Roseomonas sp. OT10]|uniref:transglutaminase family protein n=1 Tax=Roseomonas cutis TaxID=2897332 RepID=UPI001E59AA08|nr:transglutaminase family protein [Roseomonas sp. OT10]UFN48007.1 transglutaminase family protein [Roseomonas sp. OT10]
MPILAVRHVTTYRYRQPVKLGEHRILCRPRDAQDQRLLEASLEITPPPAELHWLLDSFGNNLAVARFAGRARELRVESRLRVEHRAVPPREALIPPEARRWPFAYDAEEIPDIARCMERHVRDPGRVVDRWARRFVRDDGPTEITALLSDMARAIREGFTYLRREERGVQEATRTLQLNSGTCRDFAVLMMEAVRSLGLAARFVSGYLHVPRRPGRDGPREGGGATHAWVQVYLPGAGWVEYDPTNAIIGSHDLIRVAVAREPYQAIPLSGSFIGFPDDDLGMEVEVSVREETPPAPRAPGRDSPGAATSAPPRSPAA